ncbi:sodium:solute symporter family protein [Klebsiella quasipneumoniae]|uniref:sodium:solute symporter family protein n=6 Tax=Klebsiella TaxID=570 RepID=UPI0029DCB5D5|nr:sodium:solute symporter family protein [Klebsiella quasipneumoniae]MDX6817107.1 sodium:solute symporter family protein [Klebsiella quasipneumoniae]
MNSHVFLVGFIIYALAMIWLGWYVSRHQKSGEDFLLGGRSLPLFLTLGSTVATMVGTGSSMGAVGFGYSNGWAGMLYGVGGAIGILLVAWLFAPVRKLRFMTMSEELSYYTGGSHLIKNLVGIMIFIASIGWLGAHILGGSMYLAWATGINLTVAKIIIAMAFAIYVIIGGYSAVVWTDTIQALILFFGFILMAILAVVHVGGWDAIVQAMDPKAMSLFAVDKLGTIPALSLAMVIGVGVLATPSYRQRIYSGKDVSSVRRSFVYTGVLYLFFSVLPAIIGMAAWTMNPHLENSNYAFLFATSFLPAILGLVVLIAGLSATMSSASSDAIAAVAIMMRDVYTLVTGKMPPAHKAITLSRWMLAFVIGLAMIFALTSNDIISYITKMISMLMSGLFVCSILGRFWLRFNWQGALTALLSGMLVSIVVLVKADWLAYWGNPCIPSVVGSFVSAIFVTVMTPASKISRQQALEMITQEREGTMNPHLENSNYAFLFATSFLPAILGLVVLIAGLSATMSSASSDAIAAVAIMMRDVYTLVTGKMPPAHKAITLSRWMLAFVIGLAMIFALTSNDIISYITKMISMLMSGLFVCSILGRFWLRFNWQGALTALLSGMLVSIVVLVKADWLAYWGNPCIPSVVGSFVSAIFVTVMTPASKISRQQALEMITQEREGEAIPAKTAVQVSGEAQ